MAEGHFNRLCPLLSSSHQPALPQPKIFPCLSWSVGLHSRATYLTYPPTPWTPMPPAEREGWGQEGWKDRGITAWREKKNKEKEGNENSIKR